MTVTERVIPDPAQLPLLERPTIVVSVRGTDPAVWLADPTHVYVGRRLMGPGGSWEPGRSWPRSPFANPFKVGTNWAATAAKLEDAGVDSAAWMEIDRRISHPTETRLDRSLAVACYRLWLPTQPQLLELLPTLKGKTLGCWCSPQECHADVLVEFIERIHDGN